MTRIGGVFGERLRAQGKSSRVAPPTSGRVQRGRSCDAHVDSVDCPGRSYRLTHRLWVMIHLSLLPPSSSGLGYLVLSQGTGVRVPVGVFPTRSRGQFGAWAAGVVWVDERAGREAPSYRYGVGRPRVGVAAAVVIGRRSSGTG